MRAHRIAVFRIKPRIRRQLLEAKGNTLFVFVVLQHFHLNLVADIHQIARMRQPPPRHIGNVQQPVEATEIHEGAVLSQILHHSRQDRAFLKMFESLAAFLVLLAFQQFLARDYDVAALLVDLDHRNFERLALHPIQIPDGPQIHLRARQKRPRAEDVDSQAALGTLNHHGVDRALLVVGFFNLVPGVNARGLLVREVDVAFLSLPLFPHHLNLIARLHLRLALVIKHFRERQHAFRLGADVDNHVRRRKLQHRAFDHAVFAHCLFGFGGEVLKRGSKIFAGVLVGGGLPCVRRLLSGGRRGRGWRIHGCGRSRLMLSRVLLSEAFLIRALLDHVVVG